VALNLFGECCPVANSCVPMTLEGRDKGGREGEREREREREREIRNL
jgi:hypothetical protein